MCILAQKVPVWPHPQRCRSVAHTWAEVQKWDAIALSTTHSPRPKSRLLTVDSRIDHRAEELRREGIRHVPLRTKDEAMMRSWVLSFGAETDFKWIVHSTEPAVALLGEWVFHFVNHKYQAAAVWIRHRKNNIIPEMAFVKRFWTLDKLGCVSVQPYSLCLQTSQIYVP